MRLVSVTDIDAGPRLWWPGGPLTPLAKSMTWLLPVVPYLKFAVEPVRPPAWHLVYVTALILAAGTAALLRHSRPLGLVLLSVGSAVAVVVATLLTLRSPVAAVAAHTGDLRKTTRSVTTGADHCET